MNTSVACRPGLALYAGLVALSAYGGALGLASGAIDTKGVIDDRLPFRSPVFAALALAIVVAIPATAVAVRAWFGNGRTGATAAGAGALLIAWIVVEIAFIRQLSWLQPLYVGVGTSLIVIGRRCRMAT